MRADDYRSAGKPACDYEDRTAREALVDALARDGHGLLAALDGEHLPVPLAEAATLLATVLGQDLETDTDGVFRIARRVARDRIISTVDPEARHGHKTSAHGFDGYKGHLAIDPDAELITATAVSAANAGDAAAAPELLAAELAGPAPDSEQPTTAAGEPSAPEAAPEPAPDPPPLTVYGDAAYGAGALLETLEEAGATVRCKVQPPVAPGGRFSKADFAIDLVTRTVTCPAGRVAPLRPVGRGAIASFGPACAGCPLAEQCTTARSGRTISVGPHEAQLTRARVAQRDPAWRADYRATRPKVERKIGHLMRRRHGGRRARVRGRVRVGADFALLAAAVNLARLAVLGLVRSGGTWAVRAT